MTEPTTEPPADSLGRRQDFLACAQAAVTLIDHPRVAASWHRESALAEFSVRGLAGHIAYQVLPIPELLTGEPAAQPVVGVLGHYERVRWIGTPIDGEFNTAIRIRGEDVAGEDATGLAHRLNAVIADLVATLATAPNMAVRLPFWDDWSLTLDDLLLTRTMEVVVHCDDLAASVGVDTPDFPPTAVDNVVCLLTRLAVRRHGAPAVIRALARRERAPANIVAF